MNILTSYASGLKNAFQHKKIIFVIYFINLIFALVVAIPFASKLSEFMGLSDALKPLATSFNFTAINDFMREEGGALTSIFSVGRWLIPFYLILQLFLNGGIINAFNTNNEGYSLSDFYKNGTLFFWRYLKLFLGFLIFHIVAILMVIIPLAIVFSKGIEEVESEITFWTAGYWGAGIYFMLFTLIILVSDYAKILLTKDNAKGVFKTIFIAWKGVLKNIVKMYSLFLINALVLALVYWCYWQLSDMLNPTTISITLLLLLIQQFVSIIRVYAKLTYYSSITVLTNEDEGQNKIPAPVVDVTVES